MHTKPYKLPIPNIFSNKVTYSNTTRNEIITSSNLLLPCTQTSTSSPQFPPHPGLQLGLHLWSQHPHHLHDSINPPHTSSFASHLRHDQRDVLPQQQYWPDQCYSQAQTFRTWRNRCFFGTKRFKIQETKALEIQAERRVKMPTSSIEFVVHPAFFHPYYLLSLHLNYRFGKKVTLSRVIGIITREFYTMEIGFKLLGDNI